MGHKLQNRCDLQGELGSGGMGTVYRGMDTQTERLVAVKLLRPEAVADAPDLIERFAREADALRQLDHPNIVKVLDTFEEDGRRYIVLEYVAGGSLRDLLEANGPLSIRQALNISLDLADALTRAHRLKIIHRDLKPANVLVADDGTIRLTDFGVAQMGSKERMTQTGLAIGTLDYLCPEGINGEPIDARADIWSFG